MTREERKRWNTKTLQKARTHLRRHLALLTLRSPEKKEDIEDRVMAELDIEITYVTDRSVEDGSHPSFDWLADHTALKMLDEREC